jgi:hypothetical protein
MDTLKGDYRVSPRANCTFIDSLGTDVYDLYLIITIPEPPSD